VEKVPVYIPKTTILRGVADILFHQGLIILTGERGGAVCKCTSSRLSRLRWVFKPAHSSSWHHSESGRGIPHWLWLHWWMSGNCYLTSFWLHS